MFDFVLQTAAIMLLIYGLFLAGDKKPLGPLLAAISEVLWVGVGVLHGVWGLILLSTVLAAVQGRAYLKWRAPCPPNSVNSVSSTAPTK